MSRSFCSCLKEELLRDVSGSKVTDLCPLCHTAIGLHPSNLTLIQNPPTHTAVVVHPSSIAVELAALKPGAHTRSLKLDSLKPSDPRQFDFDGFHYFGDMSGEMAHGIGTLIAPDGSRYEGEWKENRKHGFGRKTIADGSYYEGYFDVNEKHGHGIEVDANGSILREGDWEKGQFVHKSEFTSKSSNATQSLRAENSCQQHRFRYHWTCSCFLLTVLSCFICTSCAHKLQDMKCTRCGQVSD